jgi:uncharacterized protein (TIGR03000 family)
VGGGWDGGWGWGWPVYGFGWAPGLYVAAPAPTDGLAHFSVAVPAANAEVWLNGERTAQTGTDRRFKSPPIDPNKDYSYEVKARWLENGKPVERTQTVLVQANQRLTVDLAKPVEVAHFKVVVPAGDAEVWLNGQRTAQTGTDRRFQSPPITPGKDYSYEVKARWLENGQAVERTETIVVQAGKAVSVNLSKTALAARK